MTHMKKVPFSVFMSWGDIATFNEDVLIETNNGTTVEVATSLLGTYCLVRNGSFSDVCDIVNLAESILEVEEKAAKYALQVLEATP